MRELTGKQREVLAFIRTFVGKHGVPPTVREIGDSITCARSNAKARCSDARARAARRAR